MTALIVEDMPEADARRRCWFVDSKGVIVRGRTDLVLHKRPYAHEGGRAPDLLAAVERLKPNAIGLSAAFTRDAGYEAFVVSAFMLFEARRAKSMRDTYQDAVGGYELRLDRHFLVAG